MVVPDELRASYTGTIRLFISTDILLDYSLAGFVRYSLEVATIHRLWFESEVTITMVNIYDREVAITTQGMMGVRD